MMPGSSVAPLVLRIEDPMQYIEDVEALDAMLLFESSRMPETNAEVLAEELQPYSIARPSSSNAVQERLAEFYAVYDPDRPLEHVVAGDLPQVGPEQAFSLRDVMQDVMAERRAKKRSAQSSELTTATTATHASVHQEEPSEHDTNVHQEAEHETIVHPEESELWYQDTSGNNEAGDQDMSGDDQDQGKPGDHQIDPELGTSDHDRARAYFCNAHLQTEGSKKRRLSSTQSVPREPHRMLHHYAAARGLSTTQLFRLMMIGLPLQMLNALLFV